MKKRWLSFRDRWKKGVSAGLILAIVLAVAQPVSAAPSVSAQSAIVVDSVTGAVLYEKNAHARMAMASTTKLFTALIVLELCEIDETVSIHKGAVGVEGSSSYLTENEQMSVEQLLYALLLSSGNDAAEALAYHAFDGDRGAFIAHMNKRAAEIGLTDTNFCNPSGLPDDNHYTTAYELAQIGRLVAADARLSKIISTKSISFTSETGTTRYYSNHNSLLRLYQYADGMKTGYTRAAGRCLVSSATKDGVRLICVTLKASDDWNDHIRMLDHSFSQISLKQALEPEGLFASVRVAGGEKGSVAVTNADAINLPYLNNGNTLYEKHLSVEPLAFAPIQKGQTLGMAYILLDGRVVASLPLVAAADVAAKAEEPVSSFQESLEKILNLLLL